ncbi:MAG: MotA/TolQ/ExbB proton channel family protein [Lachnospiraceae bacterium]|nr:MotA/TolQ/ExbB proton channel family protein [Lachnospiraceae bacterium]
MNGLLEFLKNYSIIIINVFGVIMLLLIVYNAVKLVGHRSRIQVAIDMRISRNKLDEKTRELIEEQEKNENLTLATILNFESEFNKDYTGYEILQQLIPVFPLMGILGTVAGLMLQVRTGEGIDSIYASLGLAMGSTLTALIWAIVLKLVVALSSSRLVLDVENTLESYEKKYRDATESQTQLRIPAKS